MSDTPISDRAEARIATMTAYYGLTVPSETARELERMAGELAEALAYHLEQTRPIQRTTEALARWQAMKDASK